MAVAKAVVQRLNSGGGEISRRDEKIIESVVARNGGRTVDDGMIKFSTRTQIAQNDNVKYIQDIVDTTYLSAIWNFQMSGKDEGGYDLHAVDSNGNDPGADRFTRPNATNNLMKFRSQYALRFDGANQKLVVPPGTSNFDRIDFSRQFDLYIWCQYSRYGSPLDEGDRRIVFSNADPGTVGFDIGIEAVRDPGYNVRVYARFFFTTGQPVEYYGSNQIFTSGRPNLIRVTRNENNLMQIYVNGVLEISFTRTDSMNNDMGLTIGDRQHPSAASEVWEGEIFQIRAYSGHYLTYQEADLIQTSSPTPVTMKLDGKVWKIKDNTSPIVVHVKGNDRIPVEASMSETVLPGSNTIRNGNVYNAGVSFHEILADMFSNVASDFLVKPSSSSSQSFDGKFVAVQGLIQCVTLILLEDQERLTIFPNSIVVLENSDGVGTPYEFHQREPTQPGYNITVAGKDDSVKVNDLELIGRVRLKRAGMDVNVSNGQTVTLPHAPLSMTIRDGNNILEEDAHYTVDFDARQVTFTNASGQLVIEYDYEDLESNTDTRLYCRVSDNGDINASERYSQRIFVPQLTHREDIDQMAQRILNANMDVRDRYEIIAPGHVNNLIENRRIRVVNPVKGIDAMVPVESIEWFYPKMRTVIQAGEHQFDQFDIQQIQARAVSGAVSSTTKTQNSTA